MKRTRSATAAQSADFVEPTSVTVAPVAGGREGLPDPLLERGHGRRHHDQLGLLDGGDEAPGRLVERAPLGGDRQELGVGVVADDAPDARALRGEPHRGADQPGADDGEARDTGVSGLRMELGEPEGEVERLAGVQARVAERHVADVSCSSSTSSEPPRHSVTSSPVNSRWMPPGQTCSLRQAAKKPSISAMIASKRRVLKPDWS